MFDKSILIFAGASFLLFSDLDAGVPPSQQSGQRTPSPEAAAALIFASIDVNRDGFLSRSELAASEVTVSMSQRTAPPGAGAPSPAELARLSPTDRFLRLLDLNRDGRVSRAEFQRAFAANAAP